MLERINFHSFVQIYRIPDGEHSTKKFKTITRCNDTLRGVVTGHFVSNFGSLKIKILITFFRAHEIAL